MPAFFVIRAEFEGIRCLSETHRGGGKTNLSKGGDTDVASLCPTGQEKHPTRRCLTFSRMVSAVECDQSNRAKKSGGAKLIFALAEQPEIAGSSAPFSTIVRWSISPNYLNPWPWKEE